MKERNKKKHSFFEARENKAPHSVKGRGGDGTPTPSLRYGDILLHPKEDAIPRRANR